MIDNDQQRQEMGKKARLFAEKNFDLDENTKKMAEIFRALSP
jgi:glycosyltransferase involved in cell wall biosynthesis